MFTTFSQEMLARNVSVDVFSIYHEINNHLYLNVGVFKLQNIICSCIDYSVKEKSNLAIFDQTNM